MVFHWSLSDSKSPQVSRTRLRILAVRSNAVAWIVSVRPPISKSSRPFNPLVIVPKAPITIGTIVTFMFHSFFNSRYLSFFSLSFRFILWSAGTAKWTILHFFFLLIIMRSGLLAGIRWSVCMLKSHRSLCMAFSRRGAGLCIYHLFVWRCPWCSRYRRRKWTRRLGFKSWTWLIAFHIALIPLGKVWIQLFSLQLWVNSRTDYVLQPWLGN